MIHSFMNLSILNEPLNILAWSRFFKYNIAMKNKKKTRIHCHSQWYFSTEPTMAWRLMYIVLLPSPPLFLEISYPLKFTTGTAADGCCSFLFCFWYAYFRISNDAFECIQTNLNAFRGKKNTVTLTTTTTTPFPISTKQKGNINKTKLQPFQADPKKQSK